MSFGTVVYGVVKTLVLPPGLLVVAGLAGLVLYRVKRGLGLALLIIAPVLTWLLSMPLTAAWAARAFEIYPPIDPSALRAEAVEAIVVLGGGAYRDAPEYGGADNVRPLTLERLRYAAHLQRFTQLPLAVSGGFAPGMATSEGALMQRALEQDFGVPVAAVESGSTNTAENARLSRAALPYKKIALVTHAMHMQRAKAQFERAGFEVVAAPIGFISERHLDYVLQGFLPTLQGLQDSHYVIYAAAGALWYRYAYE